MRGTISSLGEKDGYIKIYNQREGYYFTEKSLMGISFDELKIGCYVDFYESRSRDFRGKLRANYVRPIPNEWIHGQMVRQEQAPWGETLWIIKAEAGREFQFFESGSCLGENIADFNMGDTVRFQCSGYYSAFNKAFMVTKKHIGYITTYKNKYQTGVIDFRYRFSLENINNSILYNFDTSKYFYLVSYDIDENDDGYAINITVIDKKAEILFDQSEKWIDGLVERKGVSKDSENYFIIVPKDNPINKFKATMNCLQRYCDLKFVEEGQQISFAIDDFAHPIDVTWLGYITRFPTNTVTKDMSGRINTKIFKSEVEKADPDLLYFRKYKIYDICSNEEGTKFWLEGVLIGGEKKIIPLRTAHTNLRYKVRFVKTEDKVYGEKAICIKVIGIAKAPNDYTVLDIEDMDDIAPAQVIINNYYKPVYHQINIMQINTPEEFLEMLRTNSLSNYINNISQQLYNEKKVIDGSYGLEDDIASELADKIFPCEYKELSDQNIRTLESEFEKARKIHPEISDDMLEKLSNDCSLYVKVAVIVEDTLKHLNQITLGDFSAQMVMYGKALEQDLRDSLYRLILSDDELRNYVDPKGNRFSNISIEKSMIGNYSTLIRIKNERFASICELKQKEIIDLSKTLQEWKMWWEKLQMNIDNAREIRNRSDHAGTTVQPDALLQMNRLLFSKDGIFRSLELIRDIFACYTENDKLVEELDSDEEYYDFLGHHMSGTSLIVGHLSSGRQAALHIREVKDGFTSPDEFKALFEKCEIESIKVKIIGETNRGFSLSMKGVKQTKF